MSIIKFKHSGNWKKTERFLKKNYGLSFEQILENYGRRGVEALRMYTPVDTGLTANSWYYTIDKDKKGIPVSITWGNTHLEDGRVNIAVLLQYGHGTRNGGYFEGIDYINPALQPIFEDIANSIWWEVTNS